MESLSRCIRGTLLMHIVRHSGHTSVTVFCMDVRHLGTLNGTLHTNINLAILPDWILNKDKALYVLDLVPH
jgi:hypothetical protein